MCPKVSSFLVKLLVHLRAIIKLKEGLLQVPPAKLRSIRKEIGKVLVANSLSCRKMAIILGQIRSNLTALPFLRAFTDTLKTFADLHTTHSWDHQVVIPQAVRVLTKGLKCLLLENLGRPFLDKPSRPLCSDGSDQC